MTTIQKQPTYRQRLTKRRQPVLLYAVERARLRWKQHLELLEIGR